MHWSLQNALQVKLRNRVAVQDAWSGKKAQMARQEQQVEYLEEIFRRQEDVAEFKNLMVARPHAEDKRGKQ